MKNLRAHGYKWGVLFHVKKISNYVIILLIEIFEITQLAIFSFKFYHVLYYFFNLEEILFIYITCFVRKNLLTK